MNVKNDIINKGFMKQIGIFILAAGAGYLIISQLPRIMTFVLVVFGQ